MNPPNRQTTTGISIQKKPCRSSMKKPQIFVGMSLMDHIPSVKPLEKSNSETIDKPKFPTENARMLKRISFSIGFTFAERQRSDTEGRSPGVYVSNPMNVRGRVEVERSDRKPKSWRSESSLDLRKTVGAGSGNFACGLPCPRETLVFAHGVVARQVRRRRHLFERSVCLNSRKDLESGLGHKLRRRGCSKKTETTTPLP